MKSRIAAVCVPSAQSSVPARIPARRPIASICRCTTRLLSCSSSTGTIAMRSATSSTRVFELVGGIRGVRPSELGRLDAGDGVAGEHHLHRLAHAEEPGMEVHVGHTEAHRGISHLRVLGHVDEIATRRELARAREAVAVHLGDHGLGEIPDAHPAFGDVARPRAFTARRVVRHLLALVATAEVVARRERRTRAADDRDRDVGDPGRARRNVSRMAPRSGWMRLLRFSGRFIVMRRTRGRGSSTRITSSLIGGCSSRSD